MLFSAEALRRKREKAKRRAQKSHNHKVYPVGFAEHSEKVHELLAEYFDSIEDLLTIVTDVIEQKEE